METRLKLSHLNVRESGKLRNYGAGEMVTVRPGGQDSNGHHFNFQTRLKCEILCYVVSYRSLLQRSKPRPLGGYPPLRVS
jgi:hypothetical protein